MIIGFSNRRNQKPINAKFDVEFSAILADPNFVTTKQLICGINVSVIDSSVSGEYPQTHFISHFM